MVRTSYLWSALALVLFVLRPFEPLIRACNAVIRFAFDVAFAPIAEYWRPALVVAPDVGPLQRIRTRSFLQRRAARLASFMPAGCPVLIAA